ncbi:MAG: nucleotide exchange factor GrpE [Patescibacteria group bacterium]
MFKKPSFAKATTGEAKKTEEDKKENGSKEELKKEDTKETEEVSEEQKNLEGWKRCQADFENYRKKQDESKKEFKELILEDLALQILPVVDNFQMSLDHVPENQKDGAWVQGILHIQRQLETILKDNRIEEIEAKEGDEFNPNLHEAVHQESEDSEQKSGNKIKKVISRGYKIGDKVIRAVKVVVG